MAVSPLTELDKVRNLTTSDVEALSDELIEQYLLEYPMPDYSSKQRVYLAAADCCDYLMRDETHNSESIGSQSFSGQLLIDRAKSYRARAKNKGIVIA